MVNATTASHHDDMAIRCEASRRRCEPSSSVDMLRGRAELAIVPSWRLSFPHMTVPQPAQRRRRNDEDRPAGEKGSEATRASTSEGVHIVGGPY